MKKQENNKKSGNQTKENAPGYGDKKLIGANRPSE
ncbi:hypothetical protein JOC77_002035 [Peribacillus deserti]|uniref:Spore protein n=1 Tax=Peribacillus deserti TaxID=673318 RepID=A0ABS2QI18_9BACI|nr:hypothetical protein [Peribacillus deserti]